MKFKAMLAQQYGELKVPTDAASLLSSKAKKNDSSDLCIYIMRTFLNSWYNFLKINDMDIL